jgi:hypothetical protein
MPFVFLFIYSIFSKTFINKPRIKVFRAHSDSLFVLLFLLSFNLLSFIPLFPFSFVKISFSAISTCFTFIFLPTLTFSFKSIQTFFLLFLSSLALSLPFLLFVQFDLKQMLYTEPTFFYFDVLK